MLDFWGVDIGIEALPKRETNVKKHGKTVGLLHIYPPGMLDLIGNPESPTFTASGDGQLQVGYTYAMIIHP